MSSIVGGGVGVRNTTRLVIAVVGWGVKRGKSYSGSSSGGGLSALDRSDGGFDWECEGEGSSRGRRVERREWSFCCAASGGRRGWVVVGGGEKEGERRSERRTRFVCGSSNIVAICL